MPTYLWEYDDDFRQYNSLELFMKLTYLNILRNWLTFFSVVMLLIACEYGDGVSTPASDLSLFAGNMDGAGSFDATGATARFNLPAGVATDSTGNVYVADYNNHTIRKITPTGVVTTLAGMAGVAGSTDATGVAARFNLPVGVATDSAGNVYVADYNNHTIRKITPTGVVTTLAGMAGLAGSTDATGVAARFNNPSGVATDSAGNVYVADLNNHTIRKITLAGVVTTLAGTAGASGSTDATGMTAQFFGPAGIATDSANNLYIADMGNSIIRKISSAGVVTTLAGTAGVTGSTNATSVAARFNNPTGVATDSAGNIYVGDMLSQAIRKITPMGVVTTLAGTAGARGSIDATGTAARFNGPHGIATDSAGSIYVTDSYNHTIRKIAPTGVVTTLAGTVGAYGSTDAIGTSARFNTPHGVATDSAGNVYVADICNHTIRKITPAGEVTTLAGTAGAVGSTDASGAAASFDYPAGVATDSAANVYVADTYNHIIRKITPMGVVTTLAGMAGVTGFTDAIGTAARFNFPYGVATDGAGNVYVADTYNHTIRKITPTGEVTTLAGTAGVTGFTDATGTAARFNSPYGVATDDAGNVYVADTYNHTIRKITFAGEVTTLAGTASVPGFTDATGTVTRFKSPYGVATDGAGNVYVADTDNHVIRKITPVGVVSTVVGAAGKSGFLSGVLPGVLYKPQGIALQGTSLYITMLNGVAKVTNLP